MMTIADFCLSYHCQRCGRMLCDNCVQLNGCLGGGVASVDLDSTSDVGAVMNVCKFCLHVSKRKRAGRKLIEKVHPSESPRRSSEPPSPYSTDRCDECASQDSARCRTHDSPSRYEKHPVLRTQIFRSKKKRTQIWELFLINITVYLPTKKIYNSISWLSNLICLHLTCSICYNCIVQLLQLGSFNFFLYYCILVFHHKFLNLLSGILRLCLLTRIMNWGS